MKRKLPILLVLLVIAGSLFSQNIAAYNWAALTGTRAGNDITWDITSDAAGNIYATGKFADDSIDLDPGLGENIVVSAGGDDIFLCKYSPSGQLIWARAIGGSGNDEAHSVVLDEDDNIWITGTFESTADFNPGAGTSNLVSLGARDIFLAKYDNNGNYLWAGAVGGTGDDVANKIARHPLTGDVWICGGFESTADFDPGNNVYPLSSNGAKDIFYARYNTSGTLIGARRVQGSGNDLATGLAFDKAGNLLLCGIFIGSIDFNPTGTAYVLASNNNSNDGFVAKYDLSATLLWAKPIGGKTNSDYAINVKSDTFNNVIVCGYFADSCSFAQGVGLAQKVALGNAAAYVSKYDANGNFRAIITYGAPGEYVVARDVATDIDGYMYVSGYASADFDAGNDPLNQQVITVAGKNAYLLKYDVYGNFILGHNISYGAASATGYCVHVDVTGGIVVGGELQGTGDLDPSVLNRSQTSFAGNTDALLARYFNCAIPGGLFYTSDTICSGSTADINGGANFGYTTGWYADAAATVFLAQNQYTTPALQNSTTYYFMDSVCGIKKVTPVIVLVNPRPDTTIIQNGATLTAQATNVTYQWYDCTTEQPVSNATNASFTPVNAGVYTVLITDPLTGCYSYPACVSLNPLGIETAKYDAWVTIYPNPATETIQISRAGNSSENYRIYDVTGRIVYEGELNSTKFSINVSEWKAGMYYLGVGTAKPMSFIITK